MLQGRDHQPIRAVIVDDHPLMLEVLESHLQQEEGIEVVSTAETGAEALRQVGQSCPDMLLLDLGLPDMSGIEVAERVCTEFPAVTIVALTGFGTVEDQRALLELGVRGYLPKTLDGAEIVAAIQWVMQGQTVVVSRTASGDSTGQPSDLTPREREVLQLLAEGRRNAELASALSLSVKTVEFHIHHILGKLGARSRVEAILAARRLGILSTI